MNVARYKRPEYSRMYPVLRVRFFPNAGRVCLILFLFNIAASAMLIAGVSPLLYNEMSSARAALSLVLTFLSLTVIYAIVYRIISGATDSVLGRRRSTFRFARRGVPLPDKERARGILRTSAAFALFTLIVFALAGAIAYALRDTAGALFASTFADFPLPPGLSPEEAAQFSRLLSIAVFYTGVFYVLLALSIVPFVFVWPHLAYERGATFKASLRKSLMIIRGRYFHFIGFVIFACLKNVFMILIAVLLDTLTSGFGATALSTLLGVFVFIQYYAVIAKVFYCIPIYYFSFLSVNGLVGATSTSENSDSTVGSDEGDGAPALDDADVARRNEDSS